MEAKFKRDIDEMCWDAIDNLSEKLEDSLEKKKQKVIDEELKDLRRRQLYEMSVKEKEYEEKLKVCLTSL